MKVLTFVFLGIIDDVSLMGIDGRIEIVEQEINKLRVGVLHLLCREKLYKEEQRKKKKVIIL